MLIKDQNHCQEIVAGDKTLLKELLSPYQDDIKMDCSIALARLEPGKSSVPHQLHSAEVYYIIQGTGDMHINGESNLVSQGHIIYIPPKATQSIQNTGSIDLTFVCIVDPAWRQEEEIIVQN